MRAASTRCALRWLLLLLSLTLLQQRGALAELASSPSPLSSTPALCWTDFTQAMQQRDGPQSGPYRFPCPAGCINSTRGDNNTRVIGSFPYHPSSSVCLAAIHSGLMDDAQGGTVWLSLFFSQTWDEQAVDIYPFSSAQGSWSNGVQSEAVLLPSPPTLDDFSCVVHSRGTVFNQRRQAPWSARAGHVHVAYDGANLIGGPRVGFHLIAGGRNATHYLNDVHVYVTSVEVGGQFAGNGRWHRLPDAPWSPRAFMAVGPPFLSSGVSARPQLNITMIGGQVGHACGLAELGVCVSERWQLTAALQPTSPLLFSFTWSDAALRLPFSPRCGSLLMAPPDRQYSPWAVLGGQLSYEDGSCQSQPVSTNEVWYGQNRWPYVDWTQGADAPWSPRRSMLTRNDFLPSNFAVLGGVRYTQQTHNSSSGQSRLTGAVLHADGFVCQLALNVSFGLQCDWSPAMGRQSLTPEDWGPAGSLPVPLAAAPQIWTGGNVGTDAARNWLGLQFSGVSSQAALDSWRALSRVADLAVFNESVPVSMLEQPEVLGGEFPPTTLEDVRASRHGLPLAYDLSEAELNDPSSPFNSGAPGLVTTFLKQYQNGPTVTSPSLVTAQQLSSQQFGNEPYLYSALPAAGCSNTSRALLDFVYARHSYGAATWTNSYHGFMSAVVLSGGQSGSAFHSDWLDIQQLQWFVDTTEGLAGCFHATDPSYRLLLGLGRASNCGWESSHQARVDSLVFPPLTSCDWQCEAGHHFFPPTADGSDRVKLLCLSDGLWHDPALHSFRRCEPDRRNCSHPEIDDGEGCVEPEPFVSAIRVAQSDGSLHSSGCRQLDNLTATDCPAELLTLELIGGFFTLPLAVSVGGAVCQYPELRAVDGNGSLCDGQSARCDVYGARVVCTVPQMVGYRLPVVVVSGPHRRLAAAVAPDSPGNSSSPSSPSISYAVPDIRGLGSRECRPGSSALQLVDCPTSRPFHIAINGTNLRVLDGAQRSLTQVFLSGQSLQLLDCWAAVMDKDRERESALSGVSHINCSVPPGAGRLLPLLVSVRGLGDNSHQAIAPVDQRPALSYQVCPSGSFTNYYAQEGQRVSSCELCPAGSSTNGAEGVQGCEPCAAGRFSLSGFGSCELCPVGTWSPAGAASCLNCSLNSYSLQPGLSVCDSCSLNQYVSYEGEDSGFVQCRPCLAAATCWPNGSITARAGSFILIDQQRASIASASCHSTACWGGSECGWQEQDSAPRIPQSQLPVLNCCGPGRLPASSNLLCADCQPGFAEWNGACVACSGVDVAGLCGCLLLALLLLYCLHRVPDSADSGWLSILVYYLQMALLQATHDTVPQLLSLLNLDLLGDFHSAAGGGDGAARGSGAWCIADLDAWQKLGLRVLMPLAFIAGIALLFLLQLCSRRLLFRASDGQPRSRYSQPVYHLLFTAIDDQLDSECRTGGRQAAGLSPMPSPRARSVSARRQRGVLLLAEPLLAEQKGAEHEQEAAKSACPSSIALGSQAVDSEALGFSQSAGPSLLGVGLLGYNRTLLRLVLFSYNNVTLALVSFFHCQRLDAAHGSRMYAYPSLSCASDTYTRLLPAFAIGLALVVPGLPLALFLLLRRHRGDQQLAAAHHAGQGGAAALAGRVAYARYGLLYASYRSECWYWSCVVLLQRMTLILVFVFVPAPAAFTWLTAVNVSILSLHSLVRPHRAVRDNLLESGLLLLLCLQSTLFTLYPPSLTTNSLALLLSSAVMIPALLLRLALWCAQKPGVRAAAASSAAWMRQRCGQLGLTLSLQPAPAHSLSTAPRTSSDSSHDDELL